MLKKLYFLLLITLFFSKSYSLKCANELQGTQGTCTNLTYDLINNRGQAYYACNTIITGLWYYNTCTATVSTNSIKSDNNNIVAEWWSNEADKVSACISHDGLTCNVNPLFNFQTDYSLNYVGNCDSSEQTCVKCSPQGTELLKFDGTGRIKTSINGAGNNLCESGCGASAECDEKPTDYNTGDTRCTSDCEWQSARFNTTLNLNDTNMITFTGYGSIEENKKPDNSINSELIGEITLTHDGKNIVSKYSFKINESLPSSIRIKITNTPDSQNAIILNEIFQYPNWCQSQNPGDNCQIWIWMDLDYGNEPANYLRTLVVNHESN
ncbi:MAG: hypothetical protein WC376_00940 [Candidatus Nanoarchaeia archaeon]|jgi:hypothetical protein